MIYLYRICLIMTFVICNKITDAQNTFDQMSNVDLINDHTLKATDVFEAFKERYEQSDNNNELDKYQCAKYATIAAYRAGATNEIDTWIKKADSLENLVGNRDYDKSYNFTKITWYNSNKRIADAIELLDKMEPHMRSSKDTFWMIDFHTKKVNAHAKFDDMSNALKHLLEAEKLNDVFKGRFQEALILSARAAVDVENRKLQSALEYELKAIKIYEELDNDQNLEISYNNAITMSRQLNQTALADQYMSKLNQHKLKTGCDRCYYSGELNRVLFFIQSTKYNDALKLVNQALEYADSMKLDKSHAVYLKGVIYRGLDQYDQAEIYIRQAFEMGKELKHMGKSAFYSHALYETYYWKDKFEEALEWYTIHTTYKDSVYNEEKAKEIAVLEANLENIEQKRKVEELEAKVQIDKQKKMMLWITIILGSFFAFAMFYAQRQRSRRKEAIHKALMMESNAQREKLEQQLEFKEKELASQILNMTQKNNLLKDLIFQIEDLKTESNTNAISKLLRNIKNNVENNDEWEKFLATFKSIHNSFLDSLQSICKDLSSNDIRLASLMKMNLSSKEIATMLNITDEGVKKARYRLRKKLGLDGDVNIKDWLLVLGNSEIS